MVHIFHIGLLVFGLLTILAVGNGYQHNFAVLTTVLLALFCVCVFGNRPVEPYTDTYVYVSHLNRYKNDIDIGIGFIPSKDIAWDSFVRLAAHLNMSEKQFLFCSALLFLVPIFIAFYRLFESEMLLPFLLLYSCFFFWALGTNIMRTGVGLSFFLLGISYKDNIKGGFLCFIVSILFHLSFILPVCVWMLFKYTRMDMKYTIAVWCLSLILAYLNIGALNRLLQFINNPTVNERIGDYLNFGITSYSTGFRFDFILFSLFFGGLGLFLRKKMYTDRFYDTVLKSYIIINAFFLLAINIPFSDRFAVLSWVLIPVICTYPLIKSRYPYWEYMTLFLSFFMFSLSIIIF